MSTPFYINSDDNTMMITVLHYTTKKVSEK